MFVLGDSITESAGPEIYDTIDGQLEALGWRPTIDARAGRTTPRGSTCWSDRRDDVHDVVIVLLGHNDAVDPATYRDRLETMVAELADVPLVLLLTNYEFERGRDRMNDELRLVDALHDNVQLADWDAVARATDGAIGPDGLHLTRTGAQALAATMAVSLGPAPFVEGRPVAWRGEHAVRAIRRRSRRAIAYLDHAATTPMRPEAVDAMLPFLTERFANPSGSHGASRDARRALDEARDDVAEALGCAPGDVVFTGCGTEADNLAVLGSVRRHGGVAVCPAAEHHAVLHSVEHLQGRVVGVDAAGAVDLDRLAGALDPSVRVVSVMTVNNEVGTISPLADVVGAGPGAGASGRGPHGRRPGIPVAGPAGRRRRLRPGRGVGPQVRRTQGCRCPRRPGRRRRRAAAHGWRAGAGSAQRDAQRGRDRGHGRGDEGHGGQP